MTSSASKIYIIVALGQTYARKQQPRKAVEMKGRLQELIDGENDPQVLADLFRLMNNYLKQTKLQQQELLARNTRYNTVPANDARTDWAMEWLVG